MNVVCLWSPVWSTAAASAAEAGGAGPGGGAPGDADPAGAVTAAEAGPHLAELAPRIRVEPEVVWADGSGLDAAGLATRLLDRLAELGIPARAGVAAVPIVAKLAARWGDRGEEAREAPTPFLVKERTGWGWRTPPSHSHPERGKPAPGAAPVRGRSSDRGPARLRAGSGGGGVSAATPGVVVVPRGQERAWLAPLPIAALRPDPGLAVLLDGVGVATLGALAALEREPLEVRFGPEVVGLWRLARGDDRRVLFRRPAPDRPHGSIDFVDYVLTDPARLLFTANALLGPLCERLVARGEHARALRLVLPLADGSEWDRVIRPARPTASRETWLRLLRDRLERLTVPDAVAGMRLELGATESAAVRQGDLFDRGFATAAAVEAAVARLAERQALPIVPRVAADPRVERRAEWEPADPAAVADAARTGGVGPVGPDPAAALAAGAAKAPGAASAPGATLAADTPESPAGLSLQLLPRPRRIRVEATPRRDHHAPTRLRDRGGWRDIAHAAGPDRISGGRWDADPYAREYFRCVDEEGVILWIYRDARDGEWYLHGWWD